MKGAPGTRGYTWGRRESHGEGLAVAGGAVRGPRGPTAGLLGLAPTTPAGVRPLRAPTTRQRPAAVRTRAVLLRPSEPRRPHLRDGSDSHAHGAGDDENEASRLREEASELWHAEGCVTWDERPPCLSIRALKDTGLCGKHRGRGTVPREPACQSLLLSAAVRAWAPPESRRGPGPLPALPDLIPVPGGGVGRGRAQVLEPHLGLQCSCTSSSGRVSGWGLGV